MEVVSGGDAEALLPDGPRRFQGTGAGSAGDAGGMERQLVTVSAMMIGRKGLALSLGDKFACGAVSRPCKEVRRMRKLGERSDASPDPTVPPEGARKTRMYGQNHLLSDVAMRLEALTKST
jgi:hypothetical protein